MPWTAGTVAWRVELALGAPGGPGALWDTGTWDISGIWGGSVPTWIVISGDVLSASCSRGRERFGERMRTGSASVRLANELGTYNPDHGADPPGDLSLRPGRWIRISANAGAGWVPVFTGSITSLNEAYAPAGENVVMDIRAVGFEGLLAAENPLALASPIGAGDRTDERVDRILDAFEWPVADRDLQTGVHTMPATTLARSRLEEAQRAADAEGGAFFFTGAGVATFKSRDWLQSDPRSITPQLYPGRGDPGDPDVIGVGTEWDLQVVANDIQMARVGGSVIQREDPTSQALYRAVLTETRTDFELELDSQVEDLAERYLATRAYDRLRILELEVHPDDGPEAADLLALELGDLIEATVTTLHGWGYTVPLHLMGIAYAVSADDWTLTLRVDGDLAGDAGLYWILEDPIHGVLGVTTRLRPY